MLQAHEGRVAGALLRHTRERKVTKFRLLIGSLLHDDPFRRNFRVLVPGAGLGRLAFDIAALGNAFIDYVLG